MIQTAGTHYRLTTQTCQMAGTQHKLTTQTCQTAVIQYNLTTQTCQTAGTQYRQAPCISTAAARHQWDCHQLHIPLQLEIHVFWSKSGLVNGIRPKTVWVMCLCLRHCSLYRESPGVSLNATLFLYRNQQENWIMNLDRWLKNTHIINHSIFWNFPALWANCCSSGWWKEK